MQSSLEVLFTPAEFSALHQRDLSGSACVVFDILRATTSMITALANGARGIIPVKGIPEAVELRRQQPDFLLAGERDGLRIQAAQTGGVDFDLGNSPREFTPERVSGRTIIMTTTNGTRALHGCVGAKRVMVGAFLNLAAVIRWLEKEQPSSLLLVCAGTIEEAAYEDTLAAGLLCELLWERFEPGRVADSAQMAREIYRAAHGDIRSAFQHSRNARRLMANSDLRDDVAFCVRRDVVNCLAEFKNGMVETIEMVK
jgi:2-phosphosulfolactate phosphatase